ncbi:MAG TPA: hypothetical protein VIL34_03870 [Actinopolymorphaceae bacterium]
MPTDRRGAAADRLPDELRALGRALPPPDIDEAALAAAVLERITTETAPGSDRPSEAALRSWRSVIERRRKLLVASVAGALLALALTPPVRATVADWLGLGVVVRPGPSVSTAPPPPPVGKPVDVDEAQRLVGFAPVIPRALGEPDAVGVDTDRRLLSMTWEKDGHRIRLDEFADQLSPLFFKKVLSGTGEYVEVGGRGGLWLPKPHHVVLLDENGRERIESARSAGPTLIWETRGLTLRLEGVSDRKRALEIAASTTGSGG